MYDKYPEIGASERPKQENHQSRLIGAVAAVRRCTTSARDLLDSLAGNPRDIGTTTKSEPATYPALGVVLETAPEDIHVACEKLEQILAEIRGTLRL